MRQAFSPQSRFKAVSATPLEVQATQETCLRPPGRRCHDRGLN